MIRRPLHALTAALAFAVACPAAALSSERVTLDYDVYVGGFRMLTAQTRLDLGAAGYAVRLEAALAGLPDLFLDWWAVVTADGALAGDRPVPRRHRVERLHRGVVKTIDMRYAQDGAIDVGFDPPRAQVAIAPDVMEGAIDPLSSLVTIVAQATGNGACAGRVPAFDGKRRYDLVFRDDGPAMIEPGSNTPYAGPARRCRMRMVPVAGDWDWEEIEGDKAPRERAVDIWLAAPIEGGPVVPIRIEGEVWVGRFFVHLTSAVGASAAPEAAERLR